MEVVVQELDQCFDNNVGQGEEEEGKENEEEEEPDEEDTE